MIRYVLAVLLTVVVISTASAGLEHASAVRGEQQVETELEKVDAAAISLVETDDVAPTGRKGPRRVVTLEFPDDGLTSASVDTVVFEREGNATIVHYAFEGRQTKSKLIAAPIVNAAPERERIELGGRTTSLTLTLVLRRSARDHGAFVEVTVES